MLHPTTFFIRPKQGLTLRDPQTDELLPEAGGLMPRSGFWLRRLKDGDVLEATPPSAGKGTKGDKS